MRLLKFLGRSASPILALEENAQVLLLELVDALGMGATTTTSTREDVGPPFTVCGSANGGGAIITAFFDPAEHFFVVCVFSSRLVDMALVDRTIRNRLGPYEARVVDFSTSD